MKHTIKNITTAAVSELCYTNMTEQDKRIISALFDYAYAFEDANASITRKIAQMRDDMNLIENGRVTTFSPVQTALDLEKLIAKHNEAEKDFNTVCKIAGITIESAE